MEHLILGQSEPRSYCINGYFSVRRRYDLGEFSETCFFTRQHLRASSPSYGE